MTWKELLAQEIRRRWSRGDSFSIEQVYDLESFFSRAYPRNNHVRDKLRQTLQYLRDEGMIEFSPGGGFYKRLK